MNEFNLELEKLHQEYAEKFKNFLIPRIIIRNPKQDPISEDLIEEIGRAAAVTLQDAGIDLMKEYKNLTPYDLTDVNKKNKRGELTFPRHKKQKDKLLLIISQMPVYDNHGREMIAMSTSDKKVYINLRLLNMAFIDEYQIIPEKIKAGIVTVEEVLHYLDNPKDSTTDSVYEDFHYEIESEKRILPDRKRLINHLYPYINVRLRGLDF